MLGKTKKTVSSSIAERMNEKEFWLPYLGIVERLCFHLDWNWLMIAVEFIKKTSGIAMVDGPFKKPTFVIHLSNLRAVSGQANTLKEAVFIAVSDFAKLYNEQKL